MEQPKVLVVDDNPDWGTMLVGILGDEGYLARAEQDEAGALRALREETFHLALVDVRLQGEEDEEGLTLAQEIRSLYPYTGVVLMTGYATVEQAARATRECRALDYIEKWPPWEIPGEYLNKLKLLIEKAYKRRVVCFQIGGECPHHPIVEDPSMIFVAMPFRPTQNNLYELGLRPLETTLECHLKRADEKTMNRNLMCKICQMIQEAGVCIVDITNWNANVLFELGLMYGRGKPVILIKHSEEKKEKADLKGMEFISYDLDAYPRLRESLKNALQVLGIQAKQI